MKGVAMSKVFFVLVIACGMFAQIVGEVNDSPITVQDIKLNMKSDMNGFQEMNMKHQIGPDVTDKAVNRELIYISAKEKGYSVATDPKYAAQLESYKKKLVIDYFIMNDILPTIEVSEEEIDNEYRWGSGYYTPERYQVVLAEAWGQDVSLDGAKEAISKLDFAKIAEDQHHFYQSAENNKQMQEKNEQNFHLDLREINIDDEMMNEFPEIKTATVGQVVGPLTKGERKICFSLVKKMDEESTPLAEVKNELIEKIRMRKLDEGVRNYTETLRSKAKISIDNAIISEMGQ